MARPLLDIHCIRKAHCEYPMQVKIAMDDGTVQTYNLEVEQPIENPCFKEAMEALDRLFDCVQVGYKCEQPKKKNRRNR